MGDKFWSRVMLVGYALLLLCLVGVWIYVYHAYGTQKQLKPQPAITVLNGGTIVSTTAYPDQGRYYVKVRSDDGKTTETWEVSKGFFDRVILGAPINRRDNTND